MKDWVQNNCVKEGKFDCYQSKRPLKVLLNNNNINNKYVPLFLVIKYSIYFVHLTYFRLQCFPIQYFMRCNNRLSVCKSQWEITRYCIAWVSYWIIDQLLKCRSGIASMPDKLSLFIAIATLLIECGSDP